MIDRKAIFVILLIVMSSLSMAFEVGVEYSDTICDPRALSCSDDGNQVLRCNNDGDGYETIETCTDYNLCGLNEKNEIDCIRSKTLKEKWIGEPSSFVMGILFLLVLAVLYLLWNQHKRKQKNK